MTALPGYEFTRQLIRHRDPLRGSFTRTHYGHAQVIHGDRAERKEHGGGLLNPAKPSRILRIQNGDKPVTLSVPALDLARCRLRSDLLGISDERGRYEAVPHLNGATSL